MEDTQALSHQQMLEQEEMRAEDLFDRIVQAAHAAEELSPKVASEMLYRAADAVLAKGLALDPDFDCHLEDVTARVASLLGEMQ